MEECDGYYMDSVIIRSVSAGDGSGAERRGGAHQTIPGWVYRPSQVEEMQDKNPFKFLKVKQVAHMDDSMLFSDPDLCQGNMTKLLQRRPV
ncbi:hypothetical protein PAMP_006450 [Pampus punctatissimus]